VTFLKCEIKEIVIENCERFFSNEAIRGITFEFLAAED